MNCLERTLTHSALQMIVNQFQSDIVNEQIVFVEQQQLSHIKNKCIQKIVTSHLDSSGKLLKKQMLVEEQYKKHFFERTTHEQKDFQDIFDMFRTIYPDHRLDPRVENSFDERNLNLDYLNKNIDKCVFKLTSLINKKHVQPHDSFMVDAVIGGVSAEYIRLIFHLQSTVYQTKYARDIKSLLTNPTQISMSVIINSYPWTDFIVSPKADGVRALLVIVETTCKILTDQSITKVPFEYRDNEGPATSVDNLKNFGQTIIEAEITSDSILAFDMHSDDGTVIVQEPYKKRLQQLEQFFQTYKKIVIDTKKLLLKDYYYINETNMQSQFDKIRADQTYETDGLILSKNEQYKKQQIYKWKPFDQLSVDLYVERNYQNPEQYILFTHMGLQQFMQSRIQIIMESKIRVPGFVLFPFQTSFLQYKTYIYNHPTVDDLDGKVCEFAWSQQSQQWKFLRIRTDKDPLRGQLGNYYDTANSVFQQMIHFISFDQIINPQIEGIYFKTQKEPFYDNMTAYFNSAKMRIISQYCREKNYVLDLGSGKGQDLGKFYHAQVKTLICVDNDSEALKIIQMRHQQIYVSKSDRLRKPSLGLLKLDLTNEDMCKQLPKLLRNNMGVVVCNLAIHYFINTFDVLLQQIKQKMQVGGFFIVFFMDGRKVFQHGPLEVFNDSDKKQLKYKIEFTQEYQEFQPNSTYINIKLPFSEQLMREQLVDPQQLRTIMKENRFTLQKELYLPAFNPDQFVQLQDDDKQMLDFYVCHVYKFM